MKFPLLKMIADEKKRDRERKRKKERERETERAETRTGNTTLGHPNTIKSSIKISSTWKKLIGKRDLHQRSKSLQRIFKGRKAHTQIKYKNELQNVM